VQRQVCSVRQAGRAGGGSGAGGGGVRAGVAEMSARQRRVAGRQKKAGCGAAQVFQTRAEPSARATRTCALRPARVRARRKTRRQTEIGSGWLRVRANARCTRAARVKRRAACALRAARYSIMSSLVAARARDDAALCTGALRWQSLLPGRVA